MSRFIEGTQKLGRALMLPIAVLPVAGLLLRLGQPDLLDIAFVAAAGDAIFTNLGMLFAIGVAVGLARENHGAAGVAGLVAFLVATKGAEVLIGAPSAAIAAQKITKLSVPIGLICGVIAGALYNRYSEIRLPPYLAFFGGRRFVPIAAGAAALAVALVFGLGFPYVERGMDALSRGVMASGPAGLFVYGVLNRLLIVTGLHHILNNVAWFIVGDFQGVTGDLKRFFAGDPSAGIFMAGFFPVMMFGLPAACLAMYRTARPERRRAAGGLLLSMALTSFLTGVTEPIEFTFMFLAPALYALHALLTGLAMVTMALIDCHLGFGFSAGLFDYVLNFNRSTHPWYLVPIGAVYFALYYGLFRYFIVRFDLKTPGRETEEIATAAASAPLTAGDEASAYIAALGGAANLREVEACTTRLRIVLRDRARVDAQALRRLGVRGTVDIGADGLQVVVGPVADTLASSIRARLATPLGAIDGAALRDALGGRDNIAQVQSVAGRVLVTVKDTARVDVARVESLCTRGAAIANASVHLLHHDPPSLEAALAGA